MFGEFVTRSQCGTWPPWLIVWYISVNLSIGACYFAVPWFAVRYQKLYFVDRLTAFIFAAFVFFCGAGHGLKTSGHSGGRLTGSSPSGIRSRLSRRWRLLFAFGSLLTWGAAMDWNDAIKNYGFPGALVIFGLIFCWRALSWFMLKFMPAVLDRVLVPLKDRGIAFFDSLDHRFDKFEETNQVMRQSIEALSESGRKRDEMIGELRASHADIVEVIKESLGAKTTRRRRPGPTQLGGKGDG